ncbi:MAG: Rpn family recombination-promoting nuclease/putative transposase [Planctomycetaceae bacterium]|jgi:predicted transposase YdaD|nr:Rpn family recombination-promoting nuclease/putative transposase [Planctomycetaceae bacterium]
MAFSESPTKFELAHPHDLLARRFLIDNELMANMLEHYDTTGLVQLLDLHVLQCESPVTIDYTLQEVIGDLRFSTKFKNGVFSKVFLFFEHQSKKIRSFSFDCLRKILKFYEDCTADPQNALTEDGKLPYPLVVVLYHGETSWGKLLQIRDLIAVPSGVNSYVLWFPVIMIDLSKIRHEELQGHPALIALFDTLQSYSSGNLAESFDRIIGHLVPVKNDSRCYGWANSLTRHFLSTTKSDKEVAFRTVSKIFNQTEAKKMVMSTLEELYVQGKEEGKEEGREKGREEGKEEGEVNRGIKDVLRILSLRFKRVPQSISRAVNLYKDPIALDSLLEHAATCKTLTEFEQDLAHR